MAPVLLEDELDLAGMVTGVAPMINVALVTPIGPILDHFKVEPVL